MTTSYLNVMFSDFSTREIEIANALLSGISNQSFFFPCPFDTMEQATLLIANSSEASNFLTEGPTGSYYSDETIAECTSVLERLIGKGLDPSKHNQSLMKEVKKGLVIPGKNLFSWLSEQLQKELFFFLSVFKAHNYEPVDWRLLKQEVREVRANSKANYFIPNKYGYADRDLGNIFTQMGIFVYVPETESYALFDGDDEFKSDIVRTAFTERMDAWLDLFTNAIDVAVADRKTKIEERLGKLAFNEYQATTAKEVSKLEIGESIFGIPLDGVGVKITNMKTGKEFACLFGIGYFEIEPAEPLYSPLPAFRNALNN